MHQKATQHTPIQIVQAKREHIPLIVPLFDLYRQFYQQQTDREGAHAFLTHRFQERSSVLFLAIRVDKGEDQRPCGFTQLYPTFSSTSMQRLWILNDLFVLPEERRKGIGKLLLEQAYVFAEATHAKGLTLKTSVENVAGQALYESLGWQRDNHFLSYNLFCSTPSKE